MAATITFQEVIDEGHLPAGSRAGGSMVDLIIDPTRINYIERPADEDVEIDIYSLVMNDGTPNRLISLLDGTTIPITNA